MGMQTELKKVAHSTLRMLGLVVFVLVVCAVLDSIKPAHAAGEGRQFILKLRNSVELSAAPTVRRYEKDGELLSALLQRNGVDAVWLRAGTLGTQVLRFGASVRVGDEEALLNRLRSDPEVELAIADRLIASQATSNDPNLNSQWALLSTAGTAGAKFDQAWNLVKGSRSVVVAVLDSGVVFNTPDLRGRLLAGYDFISDVPTANDGDGRDADAADPGNWITTSEAASGPFQGCSVRNSSWHGTFVSGVVAANTHNNSDVAGADWNALILPVRVLGKCGGFLSDVVDGLLWSAGLAVPGVPTNTTPATIANLSLGGGTTCSTLEQTAIDRVTTAGTLVVAAAGNASGPVESPAVCNNVLAVGALDRDGGRASYSALGAGLDIMAPGGFTQGIVGLANAGITSPTTASLSSKTGTSFSAPMVSAAAALLKSAVPSLTPAQLSAAITQNAAPFLAPKSSVCTTGSGFAACNCTTAVCGAGMLDAHAALLAIRGSRPLANASVSANGLGTSGFTELNVASNPVVLQATDSTVATGRTIASYAWQQVAGVGVLTGINSSPTVVLPAANVTSDLVFKLTLTDSVGDSHQSFTAVRVVASGDNGNSPTTVMTSGTITSTTVSTPAVSSGGGGGGGGGGALSVWGLLGLWGLLLVWRRPSFYSLLLQQMVQLHCILRK